MWKISWSPFSLRIYVHGHPVVPFNSVSQYLAGIDHNQVQQVSNGFPQSLQINMIIGD